MYSQILSQLITVGIIWVTSLLMFMCVTNPFPLLLLCIVQLTWDIMWSFIANSIYLRIYENKKTIFVYVDDDDLDKVKEIENLTHRFQIKDKIKISNDDDYKTIEKKFEGCEAIVVSGVNATLRNGIAKYCIEKNISG